MDAGSSSRFCTAKAEESPSTVVDIVRDLEAMTMVGAEEASTSRRTEYYSARCKALICSRGQFSDDIAQEIEFSKPHWSEVSRVEVAPESAEEEKLNRENRELYKQLAEEYPRLFGDDVFGSRGRLGRMIAKGGQGEIYEVVDFSFFLLKVFDKGTSLQDLRRSWPLPVLKGLGVQQCIEYALMLEDGRFAFLMWRYWGDLRKLIDQAMQEKNVDGVQGPPFPYKWKVHEGWTFHPVDFMLGIAQHMKNLHEKDISHRDLKASNVLLDNHPVMPLFRTRVSSFENFQWIIVADFECSIGVLGTGFWRAPEILVAPGKASTFTNEQWKKADVYSFGMTCFEIVTGQIPFDGELENTKADRQRVIEGKRPQLPSDLDDEVKDLIRKCWDPNPKLRPTFSEIVDIVETISSRHCQFRLFGINDKLPPQYHLATIEEVHEYPIASTKAMLGMNTANLANGSVEGYHYGLETSLGKQSNVGHKLARLHH